MEHIKLTKMELLEIESIGNRLIAIDSIMEKLIAEQTEYNIKKEATFVKLREKYNVPEDDIIIVENGKLIKFEQ